MANDRAVEEQFRVFAGHAVKAVAAFEPVITFVAHDHAGISTALGKVIAFTGGHRLAVTTTKDEVVATTAEQQVEAVAGADHVIAVIAMDHVSSTHWCAAVGDDVVAGATKCVVDALATVDTVIASITPKCVVAFATKQRVVDFGSAEDNMVDTGVTDVIVRAVTIGILADNHRVHRLHDHIVMHWVGHALQALVQFQYIVWRQEQ